MSDSIGIEEFEGLMDTGFVNNTPLLPEEEFFKSVYISGKDRVNHIGVKELQGKLQVRGKDYNLEEVSMIIINVKRILVKNIKNMRGQETVDCFCFLNGDPPWTGTSGKACGTTRADRDMSEFCKECRSNLIVAGIYCEKNGKPILDDAGAPIFCFIRGKGMKYNNVVDYLDDLYKKDLTPIFEPATEKSKEQEKQFVNNKRFVTNIGIAKETSQYGPVNVFTLNAGVELPREKVLDILKLAKKIQPKFIKKFDWSLKKRTEEKKPPNGVLTIDTPSPESPTPNHNQTENSTESLTPDQDFSFDDIPF